MLNSADRLTSKQKHVAVLAPRRHHRWLSAELGCQPSATGLFRLLPVVSGTICHSTSRLQNLCLSSAFASRLISLGAAFRDTLTVVVPEKWLCHSGHVNRFCYLLTYLLTISKAQISRQSWYAVVSSLSNRNVFSCRLKVVRMLIRSDDCYLLGSSET